MSLSINAKAYVANLFQSMMVGYAGPLKTVTVKDDVVLSATPPKPTSVFSGLSRTRSKLTRTLTLTNALTPTGDLIISIDVAVPVGCAAADIDSALNDFGAYLASASYKSLVKNAQISY